MKEWLEFFGLSFFSDKLAKKSRERGVMNCVLGFVLTLVFIFCGVLAANTVPFYTHYSNASQYGSFVANGVSNLQLSVDGGIASADKQVNTLLSEDDAQLYGKDGYNLVVDTRPSTALDDFEAYCLSKDGEQEISYEDFLTLSDEEKGGYDFFIRYTPNELMLTDGLIAEYDDFLRASTDGEITKEYAELTENQSGLTAEAYKLKLYTLYVKAYYPDISAFERVGDVPLLRSYYYRNYLNTNDITKSLFVFSDVLIGFFDTDKGLSVTFYGAYNKVPDGVITAEKIDGFIKSVFSSSVSASANIFLMNTCKYIPIIVFIPLVLAFLAKLVFVLTKNDQNKIFSFCFKVECSYLAVASLLSALVLFVCGFFVSSNTLNVLPLVIFGSIMAVRTAIYLILEILNYKKTAKNGEDCSARY